MLFVDSTPLGRILTRASSDLSVLDFNIPLSMAFVIVGVIQMITTISIMALVTWASPHCGYFGYRSYEICSGIVRINGTTKAPIMNYACETSLGAITIRAFAMKETLKLINTDARLFFYTNATMGWLVLRVETLQNLTLFTAALLLVLLRQGTIPPANYIC